MIDGNPFILVYNALWALAEASYPLSQQVRVGNRIKFNQAGQSDPTKRQVSNADLPELILVSTSAAANLRDTSSSSSCVRQYDWIIATGDTSQVNKLLPLEWALYCAMVDWPTVLAALRWPSDAPGGFVKRVNFNAMNGGLADPERNRGIVGWSSIWSIEVEMVFMTENMRQHNEAPPTTTPEPTTTP